jgi:predicted HicB family RNase H-like nuclease
MTVKRKAVKEKYVNVNVDDIISRGGKTVEDSKAQQRQEEAEVRFTLRIPQNLIDKIDNDRTSRVGTVSRNQWILESINESLK